MENNNIANDKQNCMLLTAPTQKVGFGVPRTVLWLMEVWFFKSSFVIKFRPSGSGKTLAAVPLTNKAAEKNLSTATEIFEL